MCENEAPQIQDSLRNIQVIDDSNSPVPVLDIMSQYTDNPAIEILEVENLTQRNKAKQKRKSHGINGFFYAW